MDYPNSKKARKVFLCLMVGGGSGGRQQQELPKGLEGDVDEQDDDNVQFERRRAREKKRGKEKRKAVKDKDWILKKKEVCGTIASLFRADTRFQLYRKRGKEDVPLDSKYTGRKRRAVF